MVATTDKGNLTLDNFQLHYEDIGSDTLQVDAAGKGVLKYPQKITDELLLEINTNINLSLTKYGKQSGHNPFNIGYSFTLTEAKTYNRQHQQGETEISLTIVFKKPVKKASAYSLTPNHHHNKRPITGRDFYSMTIERIY